MVKIEAHFWLLRYGTRLPFTARQEFNDYVENKMFPCFYNEFA